MAELKLLRTFKLIKKILYFDSGKILIAIKNIILDDLEKYLTTAAVFSGSGAMSCRFSSAKCKNFANAILCVRKNDPKNFAFTVVTPTPSKRFFFFLKENNAAIHCLLCFVFLTINKARLFWVGGILSSDEVSEKLLTS